MKIICPKCNSLEVAFGRDYIQYRGWEQTKDAPTFWWDYELGDDAQEYETAPIWCDCQDCKHSWKIHGESLDKYLDE